MPLTDIIQFHYITGIPLLDIMEFCYIRNLPHDQISIMLEFFHVTRIPLQYCNPTMLWNSIMSESHYIGLSLHQYQYFGIFMSECCYISVWYVRMPLEWNAYMRILICWNAMMLEIQYIKMPLHQTSNTSECDNTGMPLYQSSIKLECCYFRTPIYPTSEFVMWNYQYLVMFLCWNSVTLECLKLQIWYVRIPVCQNSTALEFHYVRTLLHQSSIMLLEFHYIIRFPSCYSNSVTWLEFCHAARNPLPKFHYVMFLKFWSLPEFH